MGAAFLLAPIHLALCTPFLGRPAAGHHAPLRDRRRLMAGTAQRPRLLGWQALARGGHPTVLDDK